MRNLTLVLKSKLCKIYPEPLLDKHQPLADASLWSLDRDKTGSPVSLWLSLQNAILCTEVRPPSEKIGRRDVFSSPDFFSEGVGTSVHRLPKCLLFRSCRAVMAIHSMELLYFREKTNWFSKEVRPLKPYKNEDKRILQETGRAKGGNTDM